MLLCKSDVRFKAFAPGLLVILAALQQFSQEIGEDILITSGSEGTHMKTSRHYKGEAIDIRSHHWFPVEKKLEMRTHLEKILGQRFTVLLENTNEENEHIHIQVKKGTSYP